MRLLALFLLPLPLISAQFARGQENKIDVDQFHLETIEGAEAHASVDADSQAAKRR